MFIPIIELILALFLVWILANIIRAVLSKTSSGGGFWGIYHCINKKEDDKKREEEIEKEVQKRVSEKLNSEIKK